MYNLSTKKDILILNNTCTNTNVYKTLSWILTQILALAVFIFCIWSSVSINVHVRRKKNLKNKRNEFNKTSLMVLAMFIPAVTAVRVLFTQTDLIVSLIAQVGATGDLICNLVSNLTTAMFIVSITPMYLFLWVRQRTVYVQPSMKFLNTVKVKLASYLALFQFFIVGIPATVFLVNNSSYRMLEHGCAKEPNKSNSGKIIGLIFISNLVVTQIILFLLFVYPLSKHYFKNTERDKANCYELKNSCNQKLKKAINFSAFSTLICTLCEVTALILATVVLPDSTPRYIISCIFDVSLLANIFAVILSFEDYKSILLMKTEKPKKKRFKQVSGLHDTNPCTNSSQ